MNHGKKTLKKEAKNTDMQVTDYLNSKYFSFKSPRLPHLCIQPIY